MGYRWLEADSFEEKTNWIPLLSAACLQLWTCRLDRLRLVRIRRCQKDSLVILCVCKCNFVAYAMHLDRDATNLRTGGACRAYRGHELPRSITVSCIRRWRTRTSGARNQGDVGVLQPRTVTADADGSACGSGALLQSHHIATCSMLTRL